MQFDVPSNEDTGVLKINPLGKVPNWLTKEGDAIYDSRVIVEYLEIIASPSLMPVKPLDKIKVKQTEALADGILDASLCIFSERCKRPTELQYPWWVDRQFRKIHCGLEQLTRMLGEKQHFFGESLTIADIAVACALGYIGLRFNEDFAWQEKYPHLSRFYAGVMARPSFKETAPVA